MESSGLRGWIRHEKLVWMRPNFVRNGPTRIRNGPKKIQKVNKMTNHQANHSLLSALRLGYWLCSDHQGGLDPAIRRSVLRQSSGGGASSRYGCRDVWRPCCKQCGLQCKHHHFADQCLSQVDLKTVCFLLVTRKHAFCQQNYLFF